MIGLRLSRSFVAEQGFEPASYWPKSSTKTTTPSWIWGGRDLTKIEDSEVGD